MSQMKTERSEIISQVKLLLGSQLVEVELDPEHYNLGVDMAVEKVYQRSDGALTEKTQFLTLEAGKSEYTLPDEVQTVQRMYRRGVGSNTSGGTNFDPFEAAFSNIYLLQAGRTGGLATWDLFAQYQETLGRIFGSEINFRWEFSNRKLTLIRKVRGNELVMVVTWVRKPEDVLLSDPYLRPWCRDYTVAQCKLMLGEGRGKFVSGIPGPSGYVQMNGDALKQEAREAIINLEDQLRMFTTSDMGMPFIIG